MSDFQGEIRMSSPKVSLGVPTDQFDVINWDRYSFTSCTFRSLEREVLLKLCLAQIHAIGLRVTLYALHPVAFTVHESGVTMKKPGRQWSATDTRQKCVCKTL